MIEFFLALFDLLMDIVTLGCWSRAEGSRTVRTPGFITDDELERLR